MIKKLRVAIIYGGRSGEHEVSLVSAKSVISALDPAKYEVSKLKISKNGEWEDNKSALHIIKKDFDVVFPVMHGTYGEDGTIQGMLEMANVPYVGCGVFASAAAMDKFMSKIIFGANGLQQADFLHFTRKQIRENLPDIKKEITQKIGFPCFVKPSNLGSSVGISKVKKADELPIALNIAGDFDASVIVEKGIDAREIECSVLGNDEPVSSIPGEVVPNREFYDFYSKYVDNASKLFIPAKISDKKIAEVKDLAIKAYKSLQCSGMARVDFLMDRNTEKFYLNEINTIPGFTSISMYPKLWEASGIKYSELIDKLIELAIERHNEKQKNKFSFDSGSDWYQK